MRRWRSEKTLVATERSMNEKEEMRFVGWQNV